MKALISSIEPRQTGYRVAEACKNSAVFDVAADLFWVDFPNTLDPALVPDDRYWYDPTDQTIKEAPVPVPSADQNKQTAMSALAATDWVNQPDVTNPDINPHLLNHAAFITYRSQIRAIAVSPTAGNLNWPILPTPEWSAA
jgi:hypothetical protein